MTTKINQHLALLCHPYMFALKEGHQIGDDLLDYSLLLLQRSCIEIIRSPKERPLKGKRKQKTAKNLAAKVDNC